MAQSSTIIHIHPAAPAKPAPGGACNGCGVCCLTEPCPVGIVLSRRRLGACDALQWDDTRAQYRCGVVQAPAQALQTCLPPGLRWSARWLAPVLGRLALRWIAAGIGCDSTLEALPADSTTMATSIGPPPKAPACEKPEHD